MTSFTSKKELNAECIAPVNDLLESMLTPTAMLQRVSQGMIDDMNKGLEFDYALNTSGPNGDTPLNRVPMKMLPSHICRMPTGLENGTFLAIDLGGTNLRVCAITLIKDGNPNPITTLEQIKEAEKKALISQCNYSTIDCPKHRCVQAHYRIPEATKTSTLSDLSSFIALMVCNFLYDNNKKSRTLLSSIIKSTTRPLIPAEEVSKEFEDGPIPSSMGFTFSFPVRQTSLRESTLITWTKGFNIPDAVNRDVGESVQLKLIEMGINISVNALINDTVGTLLANAFDNPTTQIGVILGTGTNAAYLERTKCITKLKEIIIEEKMIVNTEWGAFDPSGLILPVTYVDRRVDMESINAGCQIFEKMVSGMYLGEIVVTAIVFLMDSNVKLLSNVGNSDLLRKKNVFPTKYMQWIEAVAEEHRPAMAARVFKEHLGIVLERKSDILVICDIITAVRRRAARLSGAAIFALISKIGLPITRPIAVAIDGTLWLKYPNFKQYVLIALSELLSPNEMELLSLEDARDGSGMGAAVVAALYN